MNPFMFAQGERLSDWKALRASLPAMSEEDQLLKIAQYWGRAPLMKCAYDSYKIEEWPGPWEMVIAGDWCRDSVAAGMEFTLRLSGWSADRLSLVMIRDYDISDQMLVLKIDNEKVLNYSIDEVVDNPSTKHAVMFQYRFNGRGYSSF
jgi:hypothetical protein